MKVLKRIFIINLSAIIISLNICVFALKPIEIRANEIESNVESGAAAIPYIAELIYSLLMTAGVAVGAYELMDNAQTQKDIYRDFVQKIDNGTITIPDKGGEVFIPDAGTVSGWLKFPVSKDLFSHDEWQEIKGWTPPTPEQPPEDPEKPPNDDDYWQQLGKQSSFKVNGAFLSKIVEYFSVLFESDSELSKKVFGNPKLGGFSGEEEKDIYGKYLVKVKSYDIVYKAIYGATTYRYSKVDFAHKSRVAGLYSENGQLWFYEDFFDNYDPLRISYVDCKPLMQQKLEPFTPTNDDWVLPPGAGIAIEANQWVDANIPLFADKVSLKNYVSKGEIKGCINLDLKVDYQVGINRLTDTLKPLVGTQVSTQALINSMKKTKTAVKDRPDMKIEPYIDTVKNIINDTVASTPLPKPELKPIAPPTYPEIGTDTENSDTLRDWSKIFPFCIPFDVVDIVRILEAEPKAPRFEWLFQVDMLNFEYLIVIDLSIFDEVAKVIRMCELTLFLVGLCFATRGVIKW